MHIWFSPVQHLRCSELHRNCKGHFLRNEAPVKCSTLSTHILSFPPFLVACCIAPCLQARALLHHVPVPLCQAYTHKARFRSRKGFPETDVFPAAESKALKEQTSTYKQSPCEAKKVLPWPQCRWIACKVRGGVDIRWQQANISKHKQGRNQN